MIYFIQADNGPVLIMCADDNPIEALQPGNPRELYVRAVFPGSVRSLNALHGALAHLHLRDGWHRWAGVIRYLIRTINDDDLDFDVFEWAAAYPALREEMRERLQESKPDRWGGLSI